MLLNLTLDDSEDFFIAVGELPGPIPLAKSTYTFPSTSAMVVLLPFYKVLWRLKNSLQMFLVLSSDKDWAVFIR